MNNEKVPIPDVHCNHCPEGASAEQVRGALITGKGMVMCYECSTVICSAFALQMQYPEVVRALRAEQRPAQPAEVKLPRTRYHGRRPRAAKR